MIEMVPSQLIPLLVRVMAMPSEHARAVGLVGAPGMAKTASVRQAAKLAGAELLVWHPLLKEPIDFNGLPWVVDGKVVQLPMSDVQSMLTLAHADPKRQVWVFVDDAGQAPPATQAALMQLVYGGEFAGVKIPSNVRFIMATNRRKDKAGVGGILAPLTNRTTWFGMQVDADSWASWALSAGLPPVVPAYVRFKPDALLDPEKQSNRDIEPFCSARSLEAAARYIQAGITDHAVLAGCVGDSRATELTQFLRVWTELPDIDEVLAHPKDAKVPTARQSDVMYALIGALAYHVDAKRMGALTTYLERIPIEFQVACIKDAQAQKPELRKTKALVDWLLKNKGMLGLDDDKE